MKLLVDNQLPLALARLIAGRGVECQHRILSNLMSELENGSNVVEIR